MPGEFYIEGKKEKLDITDIKNLISTEIKNIVTDIKNLVSTDVMNIISQIQSDVTTIVTATGEQLSSADFWSDPIVAVQVNAAGITVALPSITIDGLPYGATVLRAIAMFKFRMIENTNAAANKLNGNQAIQVRDHTPGPWVDAINFVDDQFGLDGEIREAGDVCIGSIDISDVVDGNDGYEFQWLLGRADLDFINFNDVQVGIRVWYSIPPP
jgi:hypothetical protein